MDIALIVSPLFKSKLKRNQPTRKNLKEENILHFPRSKKTIYAVVTLTALCLVLSCFSPIAHSETGSNFTLPCTINTYGNAWDGNIAFDLSGNTSYLVVMNTNGTVLNLRESAGTGGYNAAYFITPDTLLFQGEPEVNVANTVWGVYGTHIWNLASNTTEDFPNVTSEHDIQYNPVNNTFLTLQDYVRQVGSNSILLDKIVEVDANGNVLWSWDTYGHIPLSEASPFSETAKTKVNDLTVEDFTHANDLDWDYSKGIIYLNLRCTNTFYAINQTTGNIIWSCGEFGNFTLLGANGQPLVGANGLPPILWYHSHDLKEVAPNVFTMFDNDYENNTNPNDCHSEMLEVTLNETSMTAHVSWNWEAPMQYWTYYGGATLILPNGDFIGDFGDPTHHLPQNSENGEDLSWNFNDTGAVFVEVNPAGQVVRTWTFPVGWYVYRIEATRANLTSAITAPSMLPSSTPLSLINSQTIISSVILVAVIVVAVVLAVAFYMRKRISNHKIDANKETP